MKSVANFHLLLQDIIVDGRHNRHLQVVMCAAVANLKVKWRQEGQSDIVALLDVDIPLTFNVVGIQLWVIRTHHRSTLGLYHSATSYRNSTQFNQKNAIRLSVFKTYVPTIQYLYEHYLHKIYINRRRLKVLATARSIFHQCT